MKYLVQHVDMVELVRSSRDRRGETLGHTSQSRSQDARLAQAGTYEEIREFAATETAETVRRLLIQSSVDERTLLLLNGDDAIFDRVLDQYAVHTNRTRLANAVSTVDSLLLL